mmetsp:Transcript_4257/g.8312  ORF Transcript_4257/g.8312 Transcript_4257/m.8312 type:complete len:98 (-) Transcript_4257:3679-3972(-)
MFETGVMAISGLLVWSSPLLQFLSSGVVPRLLARSRPSPDSPLLICLYVGLSVCWFWIVVSSPLPREVREEPLPIYLVSTRRRIFIAASSALRYLNT